MSKAKPDYGLARAILFAPYPLPLVSRLNRYRLSKPVITPAPAAPRPPAVPINNTADGFPADWDRDWRERPPAFPGIPYDKPAEGERERDKIKAGAKVRIIETGDDQAKTVKWDAGDEEEEGKELHAARKDETDSAYHHDVLNPSVQSSIPIKLTYQLVSPSSNLYTPATSPEFSGTTCQTDKVPHRNCREPSVTPVIKREPFSSPPPSQPRVREPDRRSPQGPIAPLPSRARPDILRPPPKVSHPFSFLRTPIPSRHCALSHHKVLEEVTDSEYGYQYEATSQGTIHRFRLGRYHVRRQSGGRSIHRETVSYRRHTRDGRVEGSRERETEREREKKGKGKDKGRHRDVGTPRPRLRCLTPVAEDRSPTPTPRRAPSRLPRHRSPAQSTPFADGLSGPPVVTSHLQASSTPGAQLSAPRLFSAPSSSHDSLVPHPVVSAPDVFTPFPPQFNGVPGGSEPPKRTWSPEPIEIDPRSAQSIQPSWPHPLPAREVAMDIDVTPQNSSFPSSAFHHQQFHSFAPPASSLQQHQQQQQQQQQQSWQPQPFTPQQSLIQHTMQQQVWKSQVSAPPYGTNQQLSFHTYGNHPSIPSRTFTPQPQPTRLQPQAIHSPQSTENTIPARLTEVPQIRFCYGGRIARRLSKLELRRLKCEYSRRKAAEAQWGELNALDAALEELNAMQIGEEWREGQATIANGKGLGRRYWSTWEGAAQAGPSRTARMDEKEARPPRKRRRSLSPDSGDETRRIRPGIPPRPFPALIPYPSHSSAGSLTNRGPLLPPAEIHERVQRTFAQTYAEVPGRGDGEGSYEWLLAAANGTTKGESVRDDLGRRRLYC